jgi:hypothetical protein
MTCSRLKSVMNPSLLVLCGLVLSLAASRATVAKSPADSVKDAAKVRNPSGVGINANAAKRALPRNTRGKFKSNSKLSRSLSATCPCAVSVAELSSYGSCFKQCLQDAGVSAVTLASCGAICSSSNLVGCAICVGVQEWIALACGQYCAWRKVFYNSEASLRHSRKRGVQPIKRIPKPATVVT